MTTVASPRFVWSDCGESNAHSATPRLGNAGADGDSGSGCAEAAYHAGRSGRDRACRAAPAPTCTQPEISAWPRDDADEKYATTYNNYYEFDDGKNLWRAAQVLKQRPWSISLEGMVKQPRTLDIDDLLKQVQLEERVYRHRCVEAWAMTVPWTGFPLGQLLSIAEPLGSAKYVVFETAQDPRDARPDARHSIRGPISRVWRSTRRPTSWRSSPRGCTARHSRHRMAARSA